MLKFTVKSFVTNLTRDMKTINPNMTIFKSLASATKAFNKKVKPCHLLHSKRYDVWFVDTAKEALEAWKQHYTLISEK